MPLSDYTVPHFNIERFPFMETALEMRALFQISLKSLPPFGFQPSNSPIRREKSAQSKSMAQDEGIEQYTDLNVSMCPVWVKVEIRTRNTWSGLDRQIFHKTLQRRIRSQELVTIG